MYIFCFLEIMLKDELSCIKHQTNVQQYLSKKSRTQNINCSDIFMTVFDRIMMASMRNLLQKYAKNKEKEKSRTYKTKYKK